MFSININEMTHLQSYNKSLLFAKNKIGSPKSFWNDPGK